MSGPSFLFLFLSDLLIHHCVGGTYFVSGCELKQTERIVLPHDALSRPERTLSLLEGLGWQAAMELALYCAFGFIFTLALVLLCLLIYVLELEAREKEATCHFDQVFHISQLRHIGKKRWKSASRCDRDRNKTMKHSK
jgi:hypothetical protein